MQVPLRLQVDDTLCAILVDDDGVRVETSPRPSLVDSQPTSLLTFDDQQTIHKTMIARGDGVEG